LYQGVFHHVPVDQRRLLESSLVRQWKPFSMKLNWSPFHESGLGVLHPQNFDRQVSHSELYCDELYSGDFG
jgi:hypothetical protein